MRRGVRVPQSVRARGAGRWAAAAALRIAVMLLPCLFSLPAAAWWNDDWGFRKQVTLDPPSDIVAVDDVPVALQLNPANFLYFVDTQPDGRDLRIIADDDATPLDFHIDTWDQVSGIGVLWVKVGRIQPGVPVRFWIYYGNAAAVTASQSARTFDAHEIGAWHFSESADLPRDATAFEHHASYGSAEGGSSGVLGSGVMLRPASSIRFPAKPTFAAANGFTISFWLRPSTQALDGEDGVLLRFGDVLRIRLAGGRLVAETIAGDARTQVEASSPLDVSRWHHVALTQSERLVLHVDGKEAGAQPAVARAVLGGDLVIGGDAEQPGATVAIDELHVANVPRADAWLRLAAQTQGPDASLLAYGEDETEASSGGAAAFALTWVLLDSVDIPGWITIALIGILGLISADIIVTKALALGRGERADSAFLVAHGTRLEHLVAEASSTGTDLRFADSSVYRVFRLAAEEIRALLATSRAREGRPYLGAAGLEVARSALDAALVDETNRLNGRLVFITVAISGGPFLGLLGTVVGVMTTFASIAAAGEVNVRTIAPGVAAALTTTVAGLLIAIPSLFAYNWIAQRIGRRISALEVFVDQMVSRLALAYGERDAPAPVPAAGTEAVSHAA
jgi:biopolymer transport protein ExbB